MVEQYRYPVGGRYAEFPQGSWEDRPDAEPVELACAEVEETGLVAGSMRRLGHLFETCGFSNQRFHVFLATDLAQGAQRLDAGEADLLVVRRVPEPEFLALVECGDVRNAPTLAAYALFRGFVA